MPSDATERTTITTLDDAPATALFEESNELGHAVNQLAADAALRGSPTPLAQLAVACWKVPPPGLVADHTYAERAADIRRWVDTIRQAAQRVEQVLQRAEALAARLDQQP